MVSFTLFGKNSENEALILSHITDINHRKEAEAALEASENRYKSLFEKSSFGIVTMSPQGKLIAVNEAFAKMHGYTVDEVLHMDLSALNVPESRELLESRIAAVLRGEVLNFEVGHYHKDGQILTVEVTTSAIQAGSQTYIQSFIRDVTDLKKAAAIAASNEKRYSILFEQASIGISFIGQDEQFINVNEAYARMHGYTVAEILKMKVHDLNVPGSRADLKDVARRLFAGETLRYEAEHYHKHGKIITVEITTSMVQVGNEKFIQSFLRDITSLKELKADAIESDNRYKALFQESSIGILFVGEDGSITSLNQACADMHGYSIEEMLQMNVPSLLPPEDLELFKGRVEGLMSGNPLVFKVRHRHKNGSYRTLEINGRMHQYKGQKYMQSFVRDITDILRAESALAESESRYKTIFDKAMLGIIITKMDGKILNANTAFANMLGYSPEEVIRKNVLELNSPDVLPELEKIIRGIMRNDTGNFETTMFHKSGEPRIIQVSATRVRFGTEEYILAFHWDVTSERSNQKELLMKENAIASSISGMGMADLQGNIFYVNQALCQMWGAKKPDELTRMNLRDVFHGERVLDTIKALQTRGFDQGEDTGLRLDGTLFPVEFSANVLLDKDGDPVCMFGSFLDISERKKAEERLKKKFTQISALAELSEVVGKARKNEEIFRITFEAVQKTIGADKAAILLVNNPDELDYASGFNLSEEYTAILHRHSTRHILESDMTPKLIPDVEQEEMVKSNLPMIRKEGIRSMGFFPLTHQGKLLGKLIVYFEHAHYFSVGELHLIETISRDVAFSLYEKKEQLKLISEKEFTDSIINSLPGIFYVWNKDLKILRWNKHFEEISGYLPEEITSRSPLDFVTARDRKHITDRIRMVFQKGQARAEANLLTKDGREIPYVFSAVLVKLNGETCIVGNGIDISERKKAELTLQESELRYRSLINQANDLIILSDENMNILEVNEIVKSLLGYSRENVIGKKTEDFIADGEFDLIPSQLKKIIAGESILIERKLKHKNGKLIDVELNSKMLSDRKILTFARDIRERKKTEAALTNERNLSESTINNLPGIFYLFDDSGALIRWNKSLETISGYTQKEIAKMNILDFYADEMRTIVSGAIKKGLKKSQPGLEVMVRNKNGGLLPFLFISKPILYEGKKCVIGIGMDVSKQKQTEEELIKSYSQIRQLTEHLQIVREEERAYLAREVHDVLGQQLTVLKMDMAWLKSGLKDKDASFHERLQGMDEMMDETIKTVRQISSDLRSGVLDNFGFAAAIEWQCMEFRKKTGIQINYQNGAEDVKIPQKISMGLFRIFQECLTNIARHAKATRVDVKLELAEGRLLLQISDNGIGFDARKVKDKKTLGLIGMQERSKIIHGDIRISSKPGKGTSIEINIPEKELSEY